MLVDPGSISQLSMPLMFMKYLCLVDLVLVAPWMLRVCGEAAFLHVFVPWENPNDKLPCCMLPLMDHADLDFKGFR